MDLRPSSSRSVMSVQAMLIQRTKDDAAVTQTRPSGPNAHSHIQLLLLLWVFLSLFPSFLTSQALLRSRFDFFAHFYFFFPFLLSFPLLFFFIPLSVLLLHTIPS